MHSVKRDIFPIIFYHLPLSLERQQILLVDRKIICRHRSRIARPQRMLFVEQRNADVELRPNLLPAHAGLRQYRLARIETQTVLRVSRPRSRIQIEQNMIPPIVPRRQPMQPRRNIPHIVIAQRVPVQRVDSQHEQTGPSRIRRVISTFGYRRQDLLVVEADRWCGHSQTDGRRCVLVVERIDVDEEFVVAAGVVEAGFHATGPCGKCVKGFCIVLGLGEHVVVQMQVSDKGWKFEGIVN